MNASRITATRTSVRDSATIVPLGWGRWRILTSTGTVAGLVEELPTPQGTRFRSLRYRWNARAFQAIGEFWRFDDAVSALRNG
ncbi:hypothetical protein [Microbacterium sp. 18062]|uniref:hypothetical protein n=1 Tax=Microbacterium sp. 18062 TaxID=2681410 RepID=UPI00135A8B52|nr:hypothetical protein [Microbacterium sp. 18062]